MKHKTREDQRGEKRREEKRREEKREDKKREEARQEKRQDEERERDGGKIFFKKNVSGPSNPPDELAHMFRKKIPFGRIIPPFFLRKCRIWPFLNYLQDSNSIFRAAGINSEGFFGRTVRALRKQAYMQRKTAAKLAETPEADADSSSPSDRELSECTATIAEMAEMLTDLE